MEEVQKVKNFIIKYKYGLLLIIGVLLTSIGLILLGAISAKTNTNKYTIDYTNCIKTVYEKDIVPISCWEDLKEGNNDCFCDIEYNITEPMLGQVTLYYELTNFNQSDQEYMNSRDDEQFKGVVSQTPSEKCEPFRYYVDINGTKKPIVPCGKIADSMFNDEFSLTMKQNWTLVPLQNFGMLSTKDKIGFHNPKNLKESFQNFSKPKSWKLHIWELDTNNENNNGFQNEAFISWMRTDWKRKPIARVNNSHPTFENGLPVGTYVISISYRYSYPPSKGQKLLTLEGVSIEQSHRFLTAGVIVFVVGLLVLIACALPLGWKYIEERKKRNQPTAVKPNDSDTANPRVQSEAPFLN